MSDEPVRVGVIGLGRSGHNIHLHTLDHCPQFRAVAVADTNPSRVDEVAAARGLVAHPSAEALIADPRVELVVVASPNRFHAPHAIRALEAGKHVVSEKPFGLTVDEVDAMIAARGDSLVLAPFQNRRFEQAFGVIREVIASGVLGRIVHIRTAWHGFGRRWDWQTLRSCAGGQLNNNLPHPVDQMMTLLEDLGLQSPEELEVWSDLRRILAVGDAEDHVRLTLRAPDRPQLPTVDIEFTAACPYPQDNWLVMGSAGGLHGVPSRIAWKWVDWSTMPPRFPDETSTPDRSYNREDLVWNEASRDCTETMLEAQQRFYAEVFGAIRKGDALSVTPEAVRRRIRVLELAREAAR